MLRKLRISFSIVCGIICLMMIALWIRSYWRFDEARCPFTNLVIDQRLRQPAVLFKGQQFIHASQLLLVLSLEGRVLVFAGGQDIERPGWYPSRWGLKSTAIDDLWKQRLTPPNWGYGFDMDGRYIRFPHWFPVVLTAAFAAVPWLAWSRRFSTRTMLFGMTVVALLFGAISYTVK